MPTDSSAVSGRFWTWEEVFPKCFQTRMIPKDFESVAKLMRSQSPRPGFEIAKALLWDTFQKGNIMDPLVPPYMRTLLQFRLLKPHDLLDAASNHRRQMSVMPQDGQAITSRIAKQFLFRLHSEYLVIHAVHDFIACLPPDYAEADVVKSLRAIADWMAALVAQNQDAMVFNTSERFRDIMQDIVISRQRLGMLVSVVAGNQKFTHVLTTALTSGTKTFSLLMP